MYCRRCNHDLRAATAERCPECGCGFDPSDPLDFRRRPRRPARAIGQTMLILVVSTAALTIPAWFITRGHVPAAIVLALFCSLPLTVLSFFWLGVYRHVMTTRS